MQDTYITSSELFNSIKEDFYSYDNANLIDEGQFYRHVTYILGLLGNAWYQLDDDVIEITNYRGKLPRNFKSLEQAYRCFPTTGQSILPDGVVLKNKVFGHYPDTCDTSCEKCPVPTNCVLNVQENILVQRNNIVNTYSGFALLSIGNKKTKGLCTGNCTNIFSKNPDSITIEGNSIFTNFREGNVYIQYNVFPIDEDTELPLIPNNEKVMKCIEYYIKSKILENMWVNGDGDVAQKITYFAQMYKDALGDAIQETKLPSFNTMVNSIKLNRKKLNVYQIY